MKANREKRNVGAFLPLLILSMLLFQLSSCGKKSKNKTDADKPNNGTNVLPDGSSPIRPPSTSPSLPTFGNDQLSTIQSIKNNFNCPGGQRLGTDYVYYTQGYNHNGSRTTIAGPFQEGNSPGGSSQKLYIGMSSYNDLMFVSKLTNGSQVVGYAVIVSYCSYSSNGFPYIDNSRRITGFNAPQGIVLDEDNFCGYGSVDSAQNTVAQSASIPFNYGGYQVTLPPYNIYTTFRKATCNGSY
jgi:hypothetical protein